MLTPLLGRLSAGENLSLEEMSAAIDHIMGGRAADHEIALLLTALRAKGETVDEIAGAAVALRKHMVPIRTDRKGVLDTCGTGGTGSQVFNVSTSAALVAAAAGVPVAKHGNRSVTSKSGSADVLAALGVNIQAPVATIERCLNELGICFCFAPQLHPAMKHVAAVRKQLGVGTIFNLLGPLCNPASAEFQLLGVGRADLRGTLAATLQLLGTRRAVVVSGEDGLGEVTIGGATHVTIVEQGASRDLVWTPADFGLAPAGRESLLIDGPESSARVIRSVLAGQPGPARDIVVMNAAAALWTAGLSESLGELACRASVAIDSGAARALLEKLAAMSHI